MTTTSARPGRRNNTVQDVRRWTEFFGSAAKQAGRRYGPPPKNGPQRMPVPPMPYDVRNEIYKTERDTADGRVTLRQLRQLIRMGRREGSLSVPPKTEGKLSPTPKRGAKR